MRRPSWLNVALGCVLVLAALAFVVPIIDAHWSQLVAMTVTGAAPLMASVYIPVMPKDVNVLSGATKPTGTMVVRAPMYDTQAYVSGTTTSLTFFNAINADKTLSNARGNGGTFPQNTYFEPLWVNVDFLAVNVAGANTAVGKLDDLDKLVMSGRGTLAITVGQTVLPQIPISYCHGSGGPVGATAGTWTAPVNVQFGNNGAQDSGYCVANSFTITPNSPFFCTITWAAAQTLNSTTPFIRLSIDGNWYLPISG